MAEKFKINHFSIILVNSWILLFNIFGANHLVADGVLANAAQSSEVGEVGYLDDWFQVEVV